jgi:hypothetical protein
LKTGMGYIASLAPQCHGKVMYIYKSKELWRGPESIYTLKQYLCVARDTQLRTAHCRLFLSPPLTANILRLPDVIH